jgi:hypothetical protein
MAVNQWGVEIIYEFAEPVRDLELKSSEAVNVGHNDRRRLTDKSLADAIRWNRHQLEWLEREAFSRVHGETATAIERFLARTGR